MGLILLGIITIMVGSFFTGFGLTANMDTWPVWSTPIAQYGGYLVIVGGIATMLFAMAVRLNKD